MLFSELILEFYDDFESKKAWFVQSTKLVLAVTGRRGAEQAAEDLPCGRLGEEPAENLAQGALSVDALFEWP